MGECYLLFKNREIIPVYPGGSKIITRVIKNKRGRQRGRTRDTTPGDRLGLLLLALKMKLREQKPRGVTGL